MSRNGRSGVLSGKDVNRRMSMEGKDRVASQVSNDQITRPQALLAPHPDDTMLIAEDKWN